MSNDEVTDRALDLLTDGETLPPDGLYTRCPGCDLWVHHGDETEHARGCAPLRALAGEAASSDEKREATQYLMGLNGYTAYVARMQDDKWRAAVEAMRKNENHPDETQSWIAITHNAALDALLARMEAK